MLDEEDFRRLVCGLIVKVDEEVRGTPVLVQIALKDIGFDRMAVAIRDAIEGGAYQNRPADRIFEGIVEPGARPLDADEQPQTAAEAPADGEGERP